MVVHGSDARGARAWRGPLAAAANGTAASAHVRVRTVVGWSQRNERGFLMDHMNGWMNGWMGGGMWLWTVIGVLVVVLLVVAINKLSSK